MFTIKEGPRNTTSSAPMGYRTVFLGQVNSSRTVRIRLCLMANPSRPFSEDKTNFSSLRQTPHILVSRCPQGACVCLAMPTFSEGGEGLRELSEGINAECPLTFLRPFLTVGKSPVAPRPL